MSTQSTVHAGIRVSTVPLTAVSLPNCVIWCRQTSSSRFSTGIYLYPFDRGYCLPWFRLARSIWWHQLWFAHFQYSAVALVFTSNQSSGLQQSSELAYYFEEIERWRTWGDWDVRPAVNEHRYCTERCCSRSLRPWCNLRWSVLFERLVKSFYDDVTA